MKAQQHGQVLPLGLVMLALAMMGALVLYNTGQVATDKTSLANTADAAAYSGSQWQARALNFQSYANRAMVANQVSIAQAVTLQSWVAYGAVASENIATVLKPVPVINVVASGLETGLKVVENVMSPITKAMLHVVDVVNRGLSVAQEAMFVSTFVATPDVVRAVARQSDDRFSINTGFSGYGIANNLGGWQSFTDRFDDSDAKAIAERADLINQSRDAFTRQRDWKFFKNFWFYSTPLLRHRLYREGKTELIRVDGTTGPQWEWKAKDTMSLHNRLWRWRGTKRYELPIGWAEAYANTQNSTRTIEPGACTSAVTLRGCSRFLGMNRRAEYLADTGVRSPVRQQETQIAMRGYTGLQAFRSLSQSTIDNGIAPLKLKVEVAMPVERVSNSDATEVRGHFKAPVEAPGNLISSISVAEVYYQRPDVAENAAKRLEKANLYNPYWSARLSPISNADRALAVSLRAATGSGSTPDTPEGLPATNIELAAYQETQFIEDGSAALLTDSAGAFPLAYDLNGADYVAFAGENFDTVAARYDTTDLSTFKDAISDQLNDALENAVKDMLSGSLDARLGGVQDSVGELNDRLEQIAQERVGELMGEDVVQPFADAVQEAERIARELKEEFKRIRDKISEEFEVAVNLAKAEAEDKAATVREQIVDLQRRLSGPSLNEDAREDLNKQLAQQREKLMELNQELKESLARDLMDIVSEATGAYVMPYTDALYTVGEWLRSDIDELELPWLDISDDEDE